MLYGLQPSISILFARKDGSVGPPPVIIPAFAKYIIDAASVAPPANFPIAVARRAPPAATSARHVEDNAFKMGVRSSVKCARFVGVLMTGTTRRTRGIAPKETS